MDKALRRIHILSKWITVGFALLYLLAGANANLRSAPSTSAVGFSIRYNDELSSLQINSAFLLPGEPLEISVLDKDTGHSYQLQAAYGKWRSIGRNKWQWQSSSVGGPYDLRITDSRAQQSMLLKVFIVIPFKNLKGEYLNGYRIGRYPGITRVRSILYSSPKGFIQVTEQNKAALLSPHFRLEQFLCKQEGSFPKYLVLKERVLHKLEALLQALNASGIRCETFFVMSGYRTPYYNRLIGNGAYSRHIYGDAADFFIDENPRDGRMDDLNGDGRVDALDAQVIYDIVESLHPQSWYERFIGGLGRYRASSSRGPFVHVDTRGIRARWAD